MNQTYIPPGVKASPRRGKKHKKRPAPSDYALSSAARAPKVK